MRRVTLGKNRTTTPVHLTLRSVPEPDLLVGESFVANVFSDICIFENGSMQNEGKIWQTNYRIIFSFYVRF